MAYRSLRWRAFAATLLLAAIPLLLLWFAVVGDRATAHGLAATVDTVAVQVADGWRRGDRDGAAIAGLQYAVRVRVLQVGPPARLLADQDNSEAGWTGTASRWFLGFNRPGYAELDDNLGDLAVRPEVVEAISSGSGRRCVPAGADRTLICSAAHRLTLPTGDLAVVHVEDGSRRAGEGLWAVRWIALYSVTASLLWFLWLNARMVRPIEALRDQARIRRQGAKAAIAHGHDDEFGELAETFNGLVEALEDRNRQNVGFMADWAHETKNPLAAVRAVGERLEAGGLDDARAQALAGALRDASRRMEGVVGWFLELARAEAGLPGQERVPVDLSGLVAGVAQGMQGLHPDKTVVVAAEPASVRGVPDSVEAIVRNLLDNALRHAKTTVVLRVRPTPEGVRLEVEDDGPGIAPEDQDQVFERFFTRATDQGGTGLGLALVKALTVAQGGAVEVESVLGQGARFRVWLPSHSTGAPNVNSAGNNSVR